MHDYLWSLTMIIVCTIPYRHPDFHLSIHALVQYSFMCCICPSTLRFVVSASNTAVLRSLSTSVQLLKQTLASSANWVTQAWNPQQREESLSCPYGEREKDRLLERAWEIGEMFYMPGFKTPVFPLWTDLAAVPSVCTTAGHKQIVSGGWGAWTWWQTRPGVLFLPAKPRL